MSNPFVRKFEDLRAGSKFVFVLVYRGSWCPYCKSHIRSLVALEDAITAAGGTIVIITAQTEDHLAETRAETGYKGEAINDPSNELIKDLKKRGFVDVAISEHKGYEHGMSQPAILVLKSDDTVLEKWAIVPAEMNLGGASDRPNLSEVWQNVEAKLNNKGPVHSEYSVWERASEEHKKWWTGKLDKTSHD